MLFNMQSFTKSIGLATILKFLIAYFLLLGVFQSCLVSADVKDLVTEAKSILSRDAKDSKQANSHEEHKDFDDDDHDDHDDDSKEKNNDKSTSALIKEDLGFTHGFVASLSVNFVSEIGDKTFFIAAIMAMKHPRVTVYTGAMLALAIMTFLSALLGNVITKVIPRTYTYYVSSLLFAIFGFKMLYEAWQIPSDERGSEEYEEAQENLRKVEESETQTESKDIDLEAGGIAKEPNSTESPDLTRKFITSLRKYISPILLQAFILTFLAEWGDRSQISTIILGARENIAGTIIGGTLAHALCTGGAVLAGRLIAQHISIRNVTFCGAFVFLFFAFSAFFIGPDSD
jgi:putative Ca2+/H+ antiporter (TMEM165/GDT1 family)